MTTTPFVTGAAVRDDPPSANDWGLVVRPINSAAAPLNVQELKPATATVSSVAATTASVTILALNTNRRGAQIVNDSAAARLFLRWGAGASTLNWSIDLLPGEGYEVPFPVYTGVISGAWNTGEVGAVARVTELLP